MSSAKAQTRISSFAEFWPYYLAEHSDRRCRILHFFGTSGFLFYLSSVWNWPLTFALIAGLSTGFFFSSQEARRPAFWVIAAVIMPPLCTEPALFLGVIFAYACAWIGHFVIEKNRPATFQYPLWSLAGDFRMWGEMLIGRRWR